MGNPTNYMGAEMTWFARQMMSYSKNGTNITYKYDSDGLRTQKVVNGVEHNADFVLWIGVKVEIKRKLFEQFLDGINSL